MKREELEILLKPEVREAIKINLERDPLKVALDKSVPHAREVATGLREHPNMCVCNTNAYLASTKNVQKTSSTLYVKLVLIWHDLESGYWHYVIENDGLFLYGFVLRFLEGLMLAYS